jgi:restriction system protein
MSFLFILLFIILLVMLFRIIFPVIPQLPQLKIGTPGHGHRCYNDGLNPSEKRIVALLSHGLSHKEYFIFNNLLLPLENGTSTQIDHVVVSRYGIFVIESKECSGWIFANATHEKWTTTYPTGKKYPISNPLRQNYGHTMTLKKLMPFAEDHFYNVVVFGGRCIFKTTRIQNVLYESELITYINTKKEEKLSQQRLLMAIGKLSYLCQTADMTPEQHISYVNGIIREKEKARKLAAA